MGSENHGHSEYSAVGCVLLPVLWSHVYVGSGDVEDLEFSSEHLVIAGIAVELIVKHPFQGTPLAEVPEG